jgi:hypothetical protein
MKAFTLTAILLAFSSHALALGEPVAEGSAIVGCWKRHVYSDEAMSRISLFDIYDPVQQKYQWFCFRKNGEFRVLTINKDADLSADELDAGFAAFPATLRWELLGLGVVSVKPDDDEPTTWLISFATSPEKIDDEVTAAPGSLFMGLINKEQTRYALLRVLERVE